jgi:hypothetical protein
MAAVIMRDVRRASAAKPVAAALVARRGNAPMGLLKSAPGSAFDPPVVSKWARA